MLEVATVFLPLVGAGAAAFLGALGWERLAERTAVASVAISAVLACSLLWPLTLGGHAYTIPLFSWIDVGNFQVAWALRFDALSAVMLVVVSGVSALVHFYSLGYMRHDPCRPRFFAYLSLFTFMMLILVVSDNFLQLFFGWEGVGLASYLLIGFWYDRPAANAAAIKAFIVNRVGDVGLVLAIALIFFLFGSFDYDTVFSAELPVVDFAPVPVMDLICLLLFAGAMGKSAQFLLHTWLPDAMEGPTPVSALIHAATMVTAGVFLVARCAPLYEHAPIALSVVTFVGAFTAFFAATVALVQNDIKRVIAYSTCSQLGYMFAALGIGAWGVAIFHLFTHAFFKALLFLGAGSVIHAMSQEQDMRKMGGLARKIPYTWTAMFAGTLALTGFPLTAGFFSKDAILESLYDAQNFPAFALTLISVLLTAFYAWRLFFLTFHGTPKTPAETTVRIHESPITMLLPLAVLALGALGAGAFSAYFIGSASDLFWGGVFPHTHAHHAPPLVRFAPSVLMAIGLLLALTFYIFLPSLPTRVSRTFRFIYTFLYKKWFFDELYDFLFTRPALRTGRLLWKRGDGTLIDGLGPNNIAARVLSVTAAAVRLQSGYIYTYVFAIIAGLILLIGWALLEGPVR